MSRNETIYRAAGALAAIALFVIAIVSLPGQQLRIVLALTCVIALIWRRLERAALFDLVQVVAAVVLVGAVAWIVIADVCNEGESRSAPDPQHEASPGKVIRIYNRVTSGPRMRDDGERVILTTKPAAFCVERDCNIPGTSRETGETYDAAVCQRQGEEITNGQDTSKLDDDNPGLFNSRRYYGVRLDEDTFGYVSEVWIDPKDRGGLGLPTC